MTIREQILGMINDKNLKYNNLNTLNAKIAGALGLEIKDVEKRMKKLFDEGEILPTRNDKVITAKSAKLLKGTVANKSKDYLFVEVPNRARDYYISPNNTKGAISGDTVLIRDIGGNREAEVVKVVKYANRRLVGILRQDEIGTYVETSRFIKPIYIQKKNLNNAEVNDRVVTDIIYQPASGDGLQGKVVEVLGKADDKAILEQAIIIDNNIPTEFSKDTIAQLEHIPDEVRPEDKKGRVDLTQERIFTIDGADARDLDDAVSIKVLENGNYELGVHIADVGHYVKKGSAIDLDAFERGTSVYFPDTVIPMLPKKLSNGICSLNPNVERLALSVIMEIDQNGDVIKHKIQESIIKSCQRFTYDEVFAIMNGDNEMCEKYSHLKDDILKMKKLSSILEGKGKTKGSLDFDMPEPVFKMNDEGEVLDIEARVQDASHKLIEHFMVVCNETVAKHFDEEDFPFVYRVHEKPSAENIQDVLEFIQGLGVSIEAPRKITPDFYQKLIKLYEGKPEAKVLNKVFLMSMKKARYQEVDLGHFGLALDNYCHFTSPIRRYPDLTIHRIIKDYLHKKLNNKNIPELEDFVFEASAQSSLTERRADDAERAVNDLKCAEYMAKHTGEEFEGVISSITKTGIFVQLENTVEGRIDIDTLPKDHYEYNEFQKKLAGRRNTYCLGDKIKVKVMKSDVFNRQIDFQEIKELDKKYSQKCKKNDNICSK